MPADIEIRGKYSGQAVTAGLRGVGTQIQSLGREFGVLKQITLGVLGAAGIEGAIRSVSRVMHGLADEQRSSARLWKSMELAGVDYAKQMERVNTVTSRLRDNSFFDDIEIQSGLTQLITLTGDYEGSLRNLSLVLDLAEAKETGVAESARMIALAMEGIVEPLGRVLPQMRGLGDALENLSQSDRAARVLEMITGAVGGQHSAGMNTAAGTWESIKKSIGEIAESLVSIPLEKLDALARIARPDGGNASLAGAAKSLESGSGRDLIDRQFIPGQVRGAFQIFKPFLDVIEREFQNFRNRTQFGGIGLGTGASGAAHTALAGGAGAFFGPPISGDQRESIITDRMLSGVTLRNMRFGGRLGGIRGYDGPEDIRGAGSILGGMAESFRGSAAGGGGFAQQMAEEFKKNQQIIGAPIQSAIRNGIEAGVQAGIPGAMRSLGDAILSTVINAAAAGLTNLIVPGGGVAGGLFGSLLGVFGGGGGGASMSTARNMGWRADRDY